MQGCPFLSCYSSPVAYITSHSFCIDIFSLCGPEEPDSVPGRIFFLHDCIQTGFEDSFIEEKGVEE
jgi:hypothetical protein